MGATTDTPPPGILPVPAAAVAAASPLALAAMCTIDGPQGPERFVPWPAIRALLKLMRREPKLAVLKARQLGVTWAMALFALWYVFAHPARTVLILSVGEREAAVVLRRVKRLYDSLPQVIKLAFPRVADSAERFEIGHPEGRSAIVSLPGSGGRSETAHLLILDEGAHWPDTQERLAAVLPTAADSGSVILVSTANGVGDPFETTFSEGPENGWQPVFIPADARPGRSPEWIAEQRKILREKGPQEYPLTPDEAFLSSGKCAFDYHDLDDIRKESCTPAPWRGRLVEIGAGMERMVEARVDELGDWWVWEWPDPNRDYLVAGDASGGGADGDYSAMVVVDTVNWQQVAAFHGRWEPDEFGREMRRAGYLWSGAAGPALLAPEANNHGAGVVAMLKADPTTGRRAYPRVYQREVFSERTKKTRLELGWHTDGKTRFLLVSALQAGVRERTLGIRDAAAVIEFRRFVWKPTETGGRYQADQGAHDDRTMTWGIAAAVLAHSAAAMPPPPPRRIAPRRPRVSSLTGY